MLQIGFGLNPLHSGSLTFIAAVGALFMKTMAKRMLERTGFRRLLTVNAIIGALFLAANGLFTPSTPYWLIMLVLFIGGCFRSLQFTSLNAIAYADVSNRDMSYATSLSSVAQQLSLSIGVALGAFALETRGLRRTARQDRGRRISVPPSGRSRWSRPFRPSCSSRLDPGGRAPRCRATAPFQ